MQLFEMLRCVDWKLGCMDRLLKSFVQFKRNLNGCSICAPSNLDVQLKGYTRDEASVVTNSMFRPTVWCLY